MKPRVLDLWLYLVDCAGLRDETDVVAIAELLGEHGLRPGTGHWDSVTSLTPQELAAVPQRVRESQMVPGEWGYALAWLGFPRAYAGLTVFRVKPDFWNVFVQASVHHFGSTHLSAAAYAQAWAELLEPLGESLYRRARPRVAMITAFDIQNTGFDFVDRAREGRLLVGWRTWYSPTAVQAHGADLLSGLPGQVRPMDDGGVFHQLDATVVDLVQGDPSVYERLWPYLRQHGVTPAWPRQSKPRRTSRAERERVQREVQALILEHVKDPPLVDGKRVQGVALPWGEFTAEQRDVALRALGYGIQSALLTYPDEELVYGFSELPDDLRVLLENIRVQHPRLLYHVMPQGTG